jgi:energy-coupling factor transporter ATP-binding protein EcfA2
MWLESINIGLFRNFTEEQHMTVEQDVTCLIGKNESGKTTVLKALHRLNPANNPDSFNETKDYPRRYLARDRRKAGGSLDDVAPISASFVLEAEDVDALAAVFEDVSFPSSTRVEAWRTYGGELGVDLVCDFRDAVVAACREAGAEEEDIEVLAAQEDREAVVAAARDLAKTLTAARGKAAGRVPAALAKYTALINQGLSGEQEEAVLDRLPRFFYFSNYELLNGECDLNELAQRVKAGELSEGDETMLSLLSLAGEGPGDFLEEEYDSRKAELQAASMELSQQVFKYWKQNDALIVVFDTDMPIVGIESQTGQEIRHRILKIELRDDRHGVETNFSTRSAGFQWFFSFLAAFSSYQDKPDRIVVLLDEPGTSLHGEAQGDFLRYIFGELAQTQQVLYTTHSQHMIDPTRYETMRAVHDRATREEPELGVVITPVSLSADRNTILPVEAALGYTVAKHLFFGSGPHTAVEGSSDFVFLTQMSEHLVSRGRTGLDPRVSIIPVGGIGNMPAFVALMGRRLDVRALVDGAETLKVIDKVRNAAKAAGIADHRIVVVGEMRPLPATADIEDLFTVKDYLWLYSHAASPLVETDLPPTPEPILRRLKVTRIQNGQEGEFDHALPAHELTARRTEFFDQVDDGTLDRFEELFRLLGCS